MIIMLLSDVLLGVGKFPNIKSLKIKIYCTIVTSFTSSSLRMNEHCTHSQETPNLIKVTKSNH